MSSTNSDTVDILGYKLCDLMSELFTVHKSERFIPPQTDEPWSSDMSGPYKYAVWNNDSFVLSEVANPQLASAIAGGRDSVDVGQNVKLYVNDVSTRKKLSNWGVSPAIYRSYTRSCICASSWIAESCANYILRTGDDKRDQDLVQYYEQRTAMMDVFTRLARFEELNFGPGSNKDKHPATAKVTCSKNNDDPVNKLFLRVLDSYRKRGEALLRSVNDSARDTVPKNESELKGQAAKQRRNQKKYAKKKAKKEQDTNVIGKDEQDEAQNEGVEVEQEVSGDYFDGVDEAQFDTCKDLWRKIMTEDPAETNIEGKENQTGLEKEGIDVQDFAHRPQGLHRPGILAVKGPVPWKEARRDFQGLMVRYGLEHITFIKDKLRSGESKRGDGLDIFYSEAVPVDVDPQHAQ